MLFKKLNIHRYKKFASFKMFPLEDKNPLGGTAKNRWICDPNDVMRMVHKRLIYYIRSLSVDLSSSRACRPGDSPVKNVLCHCDNQYFYLTDISDAYKNVDEKRLAKVITSVDPNLDESQEEEVLSTLRDYCFLPEEGLAMGLPASPDLFNLYAAVVIDSELRKLSNKYDVTYTRYLDDFTFSSNKPIGARKRRKFRKVITKAGFDISHHKSKVLDLSKGEVFINGIGISQEGDLFLPRHYLDRLNGCIHLALKGEVKPEKVESMMGSFKSITQKPFNRTEQKTMERYKRFRRQL